MQGKSRITNLSTRFLTLYKAAGYIFIGLSATALIYFTVLRFFSESKFNLFFSTAYFFYGLYLWWKMNRNVYHVEFDDEFLYVILKKNDILIPLENIKDINIKTLGGVYRVDLYNAEQLGSTIYFKPSLLYPFNSKKKDELVNVLWQKINKAKMKQPYFERNALHS